MNIACNNPNCGNAGARYTVPEGTVPPLPACPLCEKPQAEVAALPIEEFWSPPAPDPVEATAEEKLAHTKDLARGNVLGLLATTDRWAARAYEEGVPMAAKRVAYRQALRAKLAEINGAADPASVALPPPPA